MFIRGMAETIKAKIEHFGIDNIHEGDILVTNDDDHLRNHGFLFDGGGWRLSPLYDVVPKPQVGLERRLVLGVGPEGRNATLQNALADTTVFDIAPDDDAGDLYEKIVGSKPAPAVDIFGVESMV